MTDTTLAAGDELGTDEVARAIAQTRSEALNWLTENWDPEVTVRQWWARCAEAGWSFPTWPADICGRGLPAWSRVAVEQAFEDAGVLAPPDSPGQGFGAHALQGAATQEQLQRLLPPLARGEEAWCQLFSEPEAGSDLLALQTRADLVDGRWLINGQKTWNSAAQYADRGILLARTDPSAPKWAGITMFIISMDQPGLVVRPIRQMNDRDEFTEVFFDNAEVPDDCRIGEVNEGWKVATLALGYERQYLGGSGPAPGPKGGILDARAGDVVSGKVTYPAVGLTQRRGLSKTVTDVARERGLGADPAVSHAVAHIYILNAAVDAVTRRVTAMAASGKPAGPGGSVMKLAFSRLLRATRDVGADILGTDTIVRRFDGSSTATLQDIILTAPGLSIGAGTDQIQRNVLGERVLGLPREPKPAPTDPATGRQR
jgi:alkylation response protein AidB-like acyl-CoA dehydrogenase